VIDATTKKPIVGAKIGVLNHPSIHCISAADGSFDLPASHVWQPCFLTPGDYTVISQLSCSATNYLTYTNEWFGSRYDEPILIKDPIELEPRP
jgi:hypothetical protein